MILRLLIRIRNEWINHFLWMNERCICNLAHTQSVCALRICMPNIYQQPPCHAKELETNCYLVNNVSVAGHRHVCLREGWAASFGINGIECSVIECWSSVVWRHHRDRHANNYYFLFSKFISMTISFGAHFFGVQLAHTIFRNDLNFTRKTIALY